MWAEEKCFWRLYLLLCKMEILFKVEWLSWARDNAGDNLTPVNDDPVWQWKNIKRHNNDTEDSYTESTRGRRNPALTCHTHSVSSHAQSCLARLQSASEIWGRSSDAKLSIPWWWCSCNQRWGPLKSPHSERNQKEKFLRLKMLVTAITCETS